MVTVRESVNEMSERACGLLIVLSFFLLHKHVREVNNVR